ncbi:MAG TPA: hypothetical protein GX520_10410, partial [Syntrophaceticus sp.]|nr:hypothetical protein [Syntrophaceticus sp.]
NTICTIVIGQADHGKTLLQGKVNDFVRRVLIKLLRLPGEPILKSFPV